MLRLLFLAVGLAAAAHAEPPRDVLHWQKLPALPDALGFAGSYAGVIDDALFVAGGANFPDGPPWSGGAKIWHDRVFLLENPDGHWQPAGQLPKPSGYGVSLTLPEGVLLIGGGDAHANFADVWLARRSANTLRFDPLPSLPRPLAQHAGARLGRTVYIAGGLDHPDARTAQPVFFALDLDRIADGWRELEPWPGPERILATAATQDGAFFLFGGARLVPGPDGKPQREWLRDAWRFRPGEGWKRLADLPAPIVAAPSPAPAIAQSRILLLGGDDGAQIDVPPESHRGFPRVVRAYHTVTDTWSDAGSLPFSLVTTPVVSWRGNWIVPGGESQPAVRSTEIWSGSASR
jgi:Uncharacterized protein conserved in bacteria